MKTVYLTGFMGCGKTTVGRILASRMDRAFIDLDEIIEAQAGSSIVEIFRAQGEPVFRSMEASALAEVSGSGAVVALGGGALMDSRSLSVARDSGVIIYLRAQPDTLVARLREQTSGRPVLQGKEELRGEIEGLMTDRGPIYETADHIVDTDGMSPAQVAQVLSQVMTGSP